MPIIGFQFDKIFGERTGSIKGKVDIQHSFNITDIKKEELNLEKKQDVLKFDFNFNVIYKPDLGKISFEGHVLYLETPEKVKKIAEEWKKSKKMPEDIITPVINMILTKSNVKALILSQDINLPPQIQLPKASPVKQKTENYIG